MAGGKTSLKIILGTSFINPWIFLRRYKSLFRICGKFLKSSIPTITVFCIYIPADNPSPCKVLQANFLKFCTIRVLQLKKNTIFCFFYCLLLANPLLQALIQRFRYSRNIGTRRSFYRIIQIYAIHNHS